MVHMKAICVNRGCALSHLLGDENRVYRRPIELVYEGHGAHARICRVETRITDDFLPPMLDDTARPPDFLTSAQHGNRQWRRILPAADHLDWSGPMVMAPSVASHVARESHLRSENA